MVDEYSIEFNYGINGASINIDSKSHVIWQEIRHVFGLGQTCEDGSSQKNVDQQITVVILAWITELFLKINMKCGYNRKMMAPSLFIIFI